MDFNLVAEHEIEGLGHGNDLDYNPTTDEIYCATGTGELVILDAATLTISNTIDLTGLATEHNCWQVSYDPVTGAVYLGVSSNWYVTDETFEEITWVGSFHTAEFISETGLTGYNVQGSMIVNGTLCLMFGSSSGDGDLYFVRYTSDYQICCHLSTLLDYYSNNQYFYTSYIHLKCNITCSRPR